MNENSTTSESKVVLAMPDLTPNPRWANADNILTGLPPVGTVLAVLTTDELNEFKREADLQNAVKSGGAFGHGMRPEDAAAYFKRWREAWEKLCRTYNLSYSWPMSVDYTSGSIYVTKD